MKVDLALDLPILTGSVCFAIYVFQLGFRITLSSTASGRHAVLRIYSRIAFIVSQTVSTLNESENT